MWSRLRRRESAPESSRTAFLLDLDPELAEVFDAPAVVGARAELLVKVASLATDAALQGLDGAPQSRGRLGLLVVDGLIGRELLAEDVVALELLGPGDLLRPWQTSSDVRLLEAEVRWNVLRPTRVAVLDREAAGGSPATRRSTQS